LFRAVTGSCYGFEVDCGPMFIGLVTLFTGLDPLIIYIYGVVEVES